MASSFQLPNLPRDEKLSYIEAQKRKLVEYIKFLDDVAAQHHNEDLPTTSTASFPSSPLVNVSSPRVPPQFTEEGFEAVDKDDIALASGIAGKGDEILRRGWFYGWGGSTPATPQ